MLLLQRNWSLVPSTHIRPSATFCNSRSRRFDTFFWTLQAGTYTHRPINPPVHICIIKVKINLNKEKAHSNKTTTYLIHAWTHTCFIFCWTAKQGWRTWRLWRTMTKVRSVFCWVISCLQRCSSETSGVSI